MDRTRQADFKIGACWVRPQVLELERGGQTFRVEARSMEVLVCLAHQAPGVASKRRILEEVWGDAFVGEEVISHAIWELRKALDDDAREPRYIQTIPRKGYRLVVEVENASVAAKPRVGARIGQYDIVEELGNGAMGVVYKANDQRLHRTVALKFLVPELTRDQMARQRFEREARLAASFDHPNLATVHEIGETPEGRQYIVTAFYSGGSLQQRLALGRFDLDRALEIALQLARGLAEAHRHDIVHRDVKPGNVLLAEDGTAKLIDFGIAKLASGTRLTQTGSSLGTPAYKSPEQSRGDEVDHRSDIWSLGVLLYELVSGRLPFTGEYEHAIVRSILEDDPPPLETGATGDLSSALDRIVRKALAKDPGDRYQVADELVADLEAVTTGTVDRAGGSRFQTRWLWTAAIIVAAMAGGFFTIRYVQPFDGAATSSMTAVKVKGYLNEGRRAEIDCSMPENFEEARKSYRLGLVLDPDNSRLQALLAILSMSLPSDEAEQLETRLLIERAESDPQFGLAKAARAKAQLLQGDAQLAARTAREAIALTPEGDPDADRSYTILGQALIKLGDLDEGLTEIRKGAKAGHGRIRANLTLAHVLWDAGKWSDAAGVYEEILGNNADHCAALANLGHLYTLKGQFDDAEPKLNRAWSLAPDPSTANNRGVVYFYLDRLEEAFAAFRHAISLDPEFANPYAGLGDVYQAWGQMEDAESSWRIALEKYDLEDVAPGHAVEHLAQRAVYAAKLGRFDEAKANIEMAFEQGSPGQVHFSAARVYALAGELERVYGAMREVIRGGRRSRAMFKRDPCFGSLQDEPIFLSILRGTEPQ